MDFWTRLHPLETDSLAGDVSLSPFPRASANLIDGEARSRVENSRKPFGFSRTFVVRVTWATLARSFVIATKDREKEREREREREREGEREIDKTRKRESCYLFFCCSPCPPHPAPRRQPRSVRGPRGGSAGLFIFGMSKRVTDDATMLIPPCGN